MNPLTEFEQFPLEQRAQLIGQTILSMWESHRENLALSRQKDHPFYRDAISDLLGATRLSQAFLDSPYAEKQPMSVMGAAVRLASMNYQSSAIKSKPRGVVVGRK